MEKISELLPTKSTRRSVKKRSILIYQGEVPRQAYVVMKGIIKVYRLGNFGEEQIVGFRTKGEVFPVPWIFGKTSCALFYYEPLEDSEVLTVEKPVFLDLLESCKELKEQMFDYIMNGYTSMLLQATALEQSRAAEKLLLMMYYLMLRYGKEASPGFYHVKLRLTHSTLGSLMGLTRETTTVELGRLKRKKIVSYNSTGFKINKHELEKHLGDESFRSIQIKTPV